MNSVQFSLFDGKVCNQCGRWKPIQQFHKAKGYADGRRGRCKDCRHAAEIERMRAYQAEYKEQIAAWRRQWWPGYYQQNSERIKKRVLTWQRDNPSRTNEKNRRWKLKIKATDPVGWSERQRRYHAVRMERHPEKVRQIWARSRERHRAYRIAYHRQWLERGGNDWVERYWRSPEGKACRARINHRRRERVRKAEATLTRREWEEILAAQSFTCGACQRPFSDQLPPTRDHVMPVSKGGGLTKENVQALCKPCNSRKNVKDTDYRRTVASGLAK